PTKKELNKQIRKLISPPITAQFVSIDETLDSSESESDTSGKSFVDPPNIPDNTVDDFRKSTKPLNSSTQVNLGAEMNLGRSSAFSLQKPQTSTSVEIISGFETSVLRSLETIKFRQLQHEEVLESLKASILRIGHQNRASLDTVRIKLPMASHSDLDDFENNVSEDPSYKSELIHLKAWVSCITDDIASNFNWAGRAPKKGVKSLTIAECVYAAVRVNYPDCKRSVYEAVTKDWLKQAPARLKFTKRSCGRLE
ncbi:unnamed protein product, partial [Allacma fusca]